jgi:hypothetical protein
MLRPMSPLPPGEGCWPKSHFGWHALRNEGRGGRPNHALRSSGRATHRRVARRPNTAGKPARYTFCRKELFRRYFPKQRPICRTA